MTSQRLFPAVAVALVAAAATSITFHASDVARRRSSVSRQSVLERVARAYYPGRTGQILVSPREGDVITKRDPARTRSSGGHVRLARPLHAHRGACRAISRLARHLPVLAACHGLVPGRKRDRDVVHNRRRRPAQRDALATTASGELERRPGVSSG